MCEGEHFETRGIGRPVDLFGSPRVARGTHGGAAKVDPPPSGLYFVSDVLCGVARQICSRFPPIRARLSAVVVAMLSSSSNVKKLKV